MASPCGFNQILVSGSSGTYGNANGIYTWNDNSDPPQFEHTEPGNSYVIQYYGAHWSISPGYPEYVADNVTACPTDVTSWSSPYCETCVPPTSITQYLPPSPTPTGTPTPTPTPSYTPTPTPTPTDFPSYIDEIIRNWGSVAEFTRIAGGGL